MNKIRTFNNSNITGQFTSQALFAILMIALFIWILVYGYNAVIGANQDMSDRELLDLRVSIEQRTSICSEQSQRGRLETLSISVPQITQLCYVHSLSPSSSIDSELIDILNNSGVIENSIILLNGPRSFEYLDITTNNISLANDFIIYDIIPLREGVRLSNPRNSCVIQEDRRIEFRFQC